MLAGFPYSVDVSTLGYTDRMLAGFPYAIDASTSSASIHRHGGFSGVRKLLRVAAPKPDGTETQSLSNTSGTPMIPSTTEVELSDHVLPPLFSRRNLSRSKKISALSQPPVPSPVAAVILHDFATRDFSGSAVQLTGWLNARWAKTGYKVSIEEVESVLSVHGRAFVKQDGEKWDGAFLR